MPQGDDRVLPPEHRQRIRHISASEQIRLALRERVISLELAPGASLSRADLASYYGVSQTPVRDAMMKLEEEGLLIIYPQSRTVVSKIDVEQARETQFLRVALELEVARALIRGADTSAIAAARKALTMQEAALAADDLAEFARLDKNFHLALCEAAGVANLWRLIDSRAGHIDRLRNLNLPDPGKRANILEYHAMILSAIEDGDPKRAEKAVREHLTGTLAKADEIMARCPDYF